MAETCYCDPETGNAPNAHCPQHGQCPQTVGHDERANLGLATTRELLDELRCRIEIDYFAGGGGLDYTTVGGRPEAVAIGAPDV